MFMPQIICFYHIISPEIEVAKAIGRSLARAGGRGGAIEFGAPSSGTRARATSPIHHQYTLVIGGLFRN